MLWYADKKREGNRHEHTDAGRTSGRKLQYQDEAGTGLHRRMYGEGRRVPGVAPPEWPQQCNHGVFLSADSSKIKKQLKTTVFSCFYAGMLARKRPCAQAMSLN